MSKSNSTDEQRRELGAPLARPTAKFCLVDQAQWEQTHPAAPPFTV